MSTRDLLRATFELLGTVRSVAKADADYEAMAEKCERAASAAMNVGDKEGAKEFLRRAKEYREKAKTTKSDAAKSDATPGSEGIKAAKEEGALREAAKKAGMSLEDYTAQRKGASRGHLRKLQSEEMKI